ncbi:hypothetical protein SAMN06298224_1748 [Fibrobacter sp. UWB16]|uniref:hypothetical protein n=1 Tax=Fibrobacter sp. UWB16 TaxID=1945874 RepID=UPI000BCDC820|nr:hypothetical protein [Fibrobacter sp. UWB16]SOD14272.1 hypothetical protein SAMN06298224_1748 [Fibrobacter sp. UWB16]
MKIEKKKVVKSSKLSKFTKSAVAAALGIAASIGTTACDDSMSATGDDNKKQEPEPTCGETACGEQFSSSSYTDISSSGEHLSSEAIEALSSAKLPKSSSSIISAGIPHTYSSSSVEKPSSSSYEPIIEAGILPPYEEDLDVSSSSSDTTPTSSANESSSSSEQTPYGDCAPDDQKCIDDWRCQHNDPLCPQIYMCDDPKDPRCQMVSMVTTFEQDDIQA